MLEQRNRAIRVAEEGVGAAEPLSSLELAINHAAFG